MSREIKFRIWDKANKEYKILGATGLDARNGDVIDYYNEGDRLGGPEEYDVEQYTGLKDKNGKEIYEGDIVKFSGGEFYKPDYYVVGWHEPFACFHLYHLDGKPSAMAVDYVITNGEVVSNIHENPELLGGEE